jgi:rhodanese-related sulfurtransferase
MTLPTLSPADAARLMRERGAMLVDVREPDEHARAKIPGATNLPLSRLHEGELAVQHGRPVLFHCRSGARTAGNAAALAGKVSAAAGSAGGGCEAFIVEGGLDAWKAAGLPVAEDRRQPLELMRQVQIAAGSLVVLGVALGAAVHPGFYALSGFVGAGLVFAGATGTCGLARVLRMMPWNRGLASA